MTEAQERHIEVPKTARYWVLGEDSGLCVQALDGAPGERGTGIAVPVIPDVC